MFFTKILNAIPFIFQAIVVVVAVVVFAYFDPFNLFVATKLKLKDTPVDVQSIKDIGQLITAEYYGEVVSSYAHELNELDTTAIKELSTEMTEVNNDFINAIKLLRQAYDNKEFKRKNAFEEFEKFMGAEYLTSTHYGMYITYIYVKLKDKNYTSRRLEKNIKDRQHRNLIKDLITDKNEEAFNSIREKGFMKTLFDKYQSDLKDETAKRSRNSNLVMLGRGWVKAGFDFGSFSNDNFRYNSSSGRLYIVGLQPKIISATINPWFIPEQGVEGFEFLIVERKVKRDYKVVQIVKQRCLDELIRKANDREILTKAMDNARSSLQTFFSLLFDEPVQSVEFYDNELDYTAAHILEDSVINGEELILMDHLIQKQQVSGVESKDLIKAKFKFLSLIEKDTVKRIKIGNKTYAAWSARLAMQYEITKDGIYDQKNDSVRLVKYAQFYNHTDTTFRSRCRWSDGDSAYSYIKDHTKLFYGYNPAFIDDSTRLEALIGSKGYEWINDEGGKKVGYVIDLEENPQAFTQLVDSSVFKNAFRNDSQ